MKTGNPSACATVSWKVCISAIALYCLYLSVIKKEYVTEVLINPIIRTRTRHFVTRTTLHVTILKYCILPTKYFFSFVYLSQYRAIISLNNINCLIFVAEA
jgi:hypothetical protein